MDTDESYWKIFKSVYAFDKNVHNFQFFFKFSMKNLQLLGLNFMRPIWDEGFFQRLRAYITATPIVFFYFCSFYAIINAKTLNESVECSAGVAIGFLNNPKFVAFFLHTKTFRSLIDQAIYHTENSMTSSDEEDKLRTRYTTLTSAITKFFVTNINIVGLAFFIFPMFMIYSGTLSLAVTIKIPGVSNDTTPGYLLHVFLICYMVCNNIPQLYGFDLIFAYLSMFTSFRLDLCKHLSSKIGQMETDEKEHKLMIDVIKLHISTHNFIRDYSKVLGNVIMFQYLGSMLYMTCCMYALLNNPTAYVVYVLFIAVLLEFFIYCLFGQLVMTKFNEVSMAISDNYWYKIKNTRDRKMFLYFLMHTQSKRCFSAFGLLDLSYELFLRILRASVGYFAFLKNVS